MSKTYNLDEIIRTDADDDYADFVSWWNKKYKNKMNKDKQLENPFTIRFILYELYSYGIIGEVKEETIKYIMKLLKPSIDYILSSIPPNFDTNVPIRYTDDKNKKIPKGNKEAKEIFNNFVVKYFDIIVFISEFFTDFWDNYYTENEKLPTLQMMINEGIGDVINIYMEQIRDLEISEGYDTFTTKDMDEEYLNNILFNLIEISEYKYIIPPEVKALRPNYDDMKKEMQDEIMKKVFKLGDELIYEAGNKEIAKNTLAEMITLLLENSVPLPDVKVAK